MVNFQLKKKSNINVNAAIPELSNISNKLEETEPTIKDVNDHLSKQERKSLKELQEYQNLDIRKADKGNSLVFVDKELVMKHHLNTRTYEKVDSNNDKRGFNNLKFLIKNTNLVYSRMKLNVL